MRGSPSTWYGAAKAAVEAGAIAALVDHESSWPVPVIVVDNVRRAIGPVAHTVAGDPTTRMRVIGIDVHDGGGPEWG